MTLEGLPSAPLGLAVPCLAAHPPEGPGWIAEIKNDGYRLAIEITGNHVRCLSRAGRDVTSRYAWLAGLASALPTNDVLIDGEAIVRDSHGRTDFGWLQSALAEDTSRITYVAFDLLRLNGYDLTQMPAASRKELLRILLDTLTQTGCTVIEYASYSTERDSFLAEAASRGFESVIFKRANAPYSPGKTRDWLEVKCISD